MLEWKSQEKAITQEEEGACKREIKAIQKELAALQQPIKQAGLPVLLIFEGWSASGKGSIISKVISELDPRGYQVWSYADPTDEEGRRPLLWSFWRDLPPRGEMAVLDRSWYSRALTRLEEDRAAASGLVESINTFERQLGDDGYLILKFFLNISRREQKRRLEKLADHGATAWRVTDRDWRRNREYAARAEVTELLLQATNPVHAPWHVVQNEDKTRGTLEVLRRVRDALRAALEDGAPRPLPPEQAPWPLRAMPRLKDVDLSPSTTEEAYRAELKRERKKLQKLHSRLYREKVPVVLGFEGWDASGKGGAIRRLSWALDPRGFDVVPIAAPTPLEKSHQHLWRFWTALPKDGHVTIFDRTWYGRVMVERIEGFCSEEEWRRAYEEINHFEQELTERGAILLKFWLHISPEEQLRRFHERQNTPEKQWKITDEDWRNREKWPAYEQAVDEMLLRTHRAQAPWIVVEAENKKFARLKVLHSVINAVEEALK